MYSKEQVLKEWDKIKAYDILDTIEELEALFREKPYGKCMRKYTAYPWCKENFFFGSPEELLEYYKNFTGIPFYMYYRIGQKFHSLTILDIYQDNENTIMAKCQCDCGEVVARKLDSILKRNARSCGCIKGQGKREFSETKMYITDISKDFIKKYWDYEKNDVDPATVEIGDSRSFWWKGVNGSYEMPASCLQAKKGGTSFPEQAILFFLKSKGIAVEHRRKFEFNEKKYEADIFLPKYNVAIEYDGAVWHKEKTAYEQEKNTALCSLGLFLIRIRETGLKATTISKGCEIERDLEEAEEISLSSVINKLFGILNLLDDSLHLLSITPEEVAKSKPLIHSQYYYSAAEDNINTSWLSRLWAKENIVPPYMVSCKSSDEFIFNCHSAKIHASPNQMLYALKRIPRTEIDNVSKDLMYRGRCPFTIGSGFLCPANCKYHLDNYVENCKYSPFTHLPFKKFLLSYMERMSGDIKLEQFQSLVSILLEYAKVDYPFIILEGLKKLPLEETEKMNFVYDTFRYPFMSYEHINKVFKNQELCYFYLEHYDYSRLDNSELDLNFTHGENIYGVIASLIHEKNLNMLDKVLSTLWQKIEQSKYDNLVYNAFLQFYTKLSYERDTFFDEKMTEESLYNALKCNLSVEMRERIDSALQTDRTVFSEKVFVEYLLKLDKEGKINQDAIKFLSSRLGHSTKFYDIFIRIIDSANIDINVIGGYKRDEQNERKSYDLGSLGGYLYEKRQPLIDLYRYFIRSSSRIGTLINICNLAHDYDEKMSFDTRHLIHAKAYRDEYKSIFYTKELNYFEFFFECKEDEVHKKYGKYATDIIPIAKPVEIDKPKEENKNDSGVSFDFADLFSITIKPVFPTTSAVSEEHHKQNKPNDLFDIKVNSKDFDGAILERLRENDYVLHKIFLPVYSFLINIGLPKERILDTVRNAYAIFNKGNFALDNFSDFLDKQTKLKIKENISKLNRTIPDPSLVEDIVHSYYDDSLNNNMLLLWLLGSGYQKDFIEKTKKISTYYSQLRDCIIEAMEYQALMVFIKIFYLEREAVKIEKDNTLKNIIVNAILKHVEVDRISQNTHGAFLSYSNFLKSQFTYQHYKSLMIIYIVSKQTCEDFIDKKQFESLININNSTMSEIVEFIIQEKLYNRYDTHKLLLGVLYAKAATYSDLESFINEWKSIPLYLKKCNAAKQTKIYTPEQKPQKVEITVHGVDLETKRKQQEQQRREESRKRQEKIDRQKASYRNQGLCQYCGGTFKKKFLFFTSDICSRCGKKKDY